MLNEIYKQVKRCLNTVPGLQGVEWFNNQYQGIIHAEPVVFVEFPEPVVPDPVTKTTRWPI